MISIAIRTLRHQRIPNLCPALRWKGQFIETEPDPTVPPPTMACSGACTPRPASVRTANWPSRATAIRRDAAATARDSAAEIRVRQTLLPLSFRARGANTDRARVRNPVLQCRRRKLSLHVAF